MWFINFMLNVAFTTLLFNFALAPVLDTPPLNPIQGALLYLFIVLTREDFKIELKS